MGIKKSSSNRSENRKQSITKERERPVLVETGGHAARSFAIEAAGSIEHEIRSRAYELYEARGRQPGFDQDDWIQAEAEVLSRHKASA